MLQSAYNPPWMPPNVPPRPFPNNRPGGPGPSRPGNGPARPGGPLPPRPPRPLQVREMRDTRGPANPNEPRRNNQIRVPVVQLIDAEGTARGNVSTATALAMAADAGLDLVEINPKLTPPLVKILDWGKFQYQQKQKSKGNKASKNAELKEVKFGFAIDKGDRDTKLRHIYDFLDKGHQVRAAMQLRGRQNAMQELAKQKFQDIVNLIAAEGYSVPSDGIKAAGNTLFVTLSGGKKKLPNQDGKPA